jgi:hypothetical protein
MRYLLSVCLLGLCSFTFASTQSCPQCSLDCCKDGKCPCAKDGCKCGDTCKCVPGKRAPDCKCGADCPCAKVCDKKGCDKGCACGKDCKCVPGKRAPDCKCGPNCPCAKVKGCLSIADGLKEAAKTGKWVILWVGCTDEELQGNLPDCVHCYEERVVGFPCPCVAVPSVRVGRFGRTQAVWYTFGCQPLPTANQLRRAAMPATRRGVPLPPPPVMVPALPNCPKVEQPIPSRDWTSPDSPDANRRTSQSPINTTPPYTPPWTPSRERWLPFPVNRSSGSC